MRDGDGHGAWRRVAHAAMLIGLVIASFDLGGAPVIDDAQAIDRSVCVTGPFDPELVFTSNFWCERGAFRSIQSWRPWPVLTWWLVWRLGPGTVPFTLLNIALHVACIWTVFALGRTLRLPERAAALAALLFAPLAVHVDAVATGVGAADLWSSLFVLTAVLAFVRGSVWAVLLAGLALLSKESGVLAFAWAAAALVFLGTDLPREHRVRQTILLAAMGVCTLVILAWRAQALGAWLGTQIPAFVNPLVDVDLVERAPTAVALIGRYHRITVLGGPLSADYAHAAIGVGEHLSWGDAFIGAICTVGWAWIGWRQRKRAAVLTVVVWIVGTSIFVGNLLFVLPALFADRLFYLPSAAIALAAGVGIDRLLQDERVRPALAHAALVAFVTAQAVLSIAHTLRYRDEPTIVRHTVEVTPNNARARMWLAIHLLREGQLEEAAEHVAVARTIRPDWGLPRAAEGVLEDLAGRPQVAVSRFREAMQRDPQDGQIADLFIQFLLRHGHRELARTVYQAHAAARGLPDPNVTIP